MNLYPEHLETEVTPEGIIFENEFCGFLRSNGYPVNDVHDTEVIESNSDPHAYLVQKIETMSLPSDHPDLDIVEDGVEVAICSCDGFRYHHSPNVSEPNENPQDGSVCPHILDAYREQRAKEDPDQLTFNGGE